MENDQILEHCCRICLKDVSSINGQVFNVENAVEELQEQEGQWSYEKMFHICTGYSVTDAEPRLICCWCAADLINCYRFKERCEKTQKTLDSHVPKLEVIEVKVEMEDLGINGSKKGLSFKPWRYDETDDSEEMNSGFLYETLESDECGVERLEPDYDRKAIKRLAKEHAEKRSKERKIPGQRHKCEYCETSYKHRSNLLHHYKSQHLDQKVNECSFCKETFFTQTLLEQHQKDCSRRPRRVEVKKRHLCPVCGKPSSNNHILYHTQKQARHESNSNGLNKETFICDICGVSVTSRYSMINHMKVQHFNQRTKCKYCEATFRSPSYLSTHVRKIHLQETPIYKCGKCDYVATSDTYLKRHRMTHSGKKPLKCTVCEYECFTKYSYDCHMASHSDARPHTCDVCGSAFKTTKALRSHKKTHAEYDYECPVCQKGFFSNHLMRAHAKKLHPDYALPPPGTIFSKSALKRMAEKELQEMAMRNGAAENEVNC